MLDLESEVTRGSGSIPTEGNILLLEIFFTSDANVGVIANFVYLWENSNTCPDYKDKGFIIS